MHTYLIFFCLFHPILFLEYRRAQKLTGCYTPEELNRALRKWLGPYSAASKEKFQSEKPLQIARDLYSLRHSRHKDSA